MKTSALVLAAAAALCTLSATQDSAASFYPPDYPMCSAHDPLTTGPVALITAT